jgi:hypothetical protein
MRRQFLLVLFSIISIYSNVLSAQGETNPFELIYRLDSVEISSPSQAPVQFTTDNPFDIVRVTVLDPEVRQKALMEKEKAIKLEKADDEDRIQFILLMASIAFLVFLFVLFRGFIKKAFRAFSSDNLLRQFKRDMRIGIDLPYVLLFINYLINISIFIFFSFREARLPGYNHYVQFLILLGLVAAIHFGKQLLLNFTAFLLPIQKEIGLYVFSIVVFGAVFGILILPINVMLLYGPEDSSSAVQIILLVMLAGMLVFRYLRVAYLSSRFLLLNKFHFLLYICSVEVAPVLITIRLIFPNYTGI